MLWASISSVITSSFSVGCGWIIKFKETLKNQDLEKNRMNRSINQFELFLHLCITWFKIQIPRGKASDRPGSDHAAIHALWLTVGLRLHGMTGEKDALWRELPDRDLTTGKGTGPAHGNLTERPAVIRSLTLLLPSPFYVLQVPLTGQPSWRLEGKGAHWYGLYEVSLLDNTTVYVECP